MGTEIKPENLFVGAVIYKVYGDRINSIQTIERVTKTMAFSGIDKFKIGISKSGQVTKMGNNLSWTTYGYYIENERLKEMLNRQNLNYAIKEALRNTESFTTDQLQRIKSITQENQ